VRLVSGYAQTLWVVSVAGMALALVSMGLDELLGFGPPWLETAGVVGLAVALGSFFALLLLAGRARLRGQRTL
jgi:hypothetical protein